ncbi:MAG: hypothetical protein M1822_001359 [Bathelium mastoideum]|nr:MAG: hypothetical protein M1822_001359 [Bathelium mastoideum]
MAASSASQQGQDIEARELVKSFSFELEDDMNHSRLDNSTKAVTEGMILHRDHEDAKTKELERWREYFDGDPWTNDSDFAMLDIESHNLRDAKEQFLKSLPADDRYASTKSKQDPASIVTLVNSAIIAWEKKHESSVFGKAKKLFNKVCSSIDQHSVLLELLPKQNNYVALFYGSLQVVIKASVNYQKVAEGFSQALSEISDEIAAVARLFPVFHTKSMRGAVARIYAQIFLFLKRVMKWYMQKSIRRFLGSFREDMYDHFQDDVSLIKRLSQNVLREAQTSAFAEERYTRLRLEGADEKLQSLLDIVGRQGAERKAAEEKMHHERMQRERDHFKEAQAWFDRRLQDVLRQFSEQLPYRLGEAATVMLQNQASIHLSIGNEESAYTARHLEYPASPLSPGRLSPVPSVSSDTESDTSGQYVRTRSELQLFSADLAKWYQPEKIYLELAGNSFVEQSVVSALQDWNIEDRSSRLYISGPSQASPMPPSSIVAAEYVSSAVQLGLPTISYFCCLEDRDSRRLGMTSEAQELIALTYSLIRQLLELIPPEVHTFGPTFEEARFKGLNGTLDTYTDALSLLDDLLSLIAPFLLIVIDGLECLDERGIETCLAALVATLDIEHSSRNVAGSSNAGRAIFKVLFTTAGSCGTLSEGLPADEIVIMMQASSRRTPGKARPGRQSLSPVVSELSRDGRE